MQPRGFTLIELAIVMMVLGVLAGFGLGFLQRRGNDLEIALEIVRDQVRAAGLTARSKHVPASVEFLVDDDTGEVSVQSRVLVPVGHWPMEDSVHGDPRLTPNTLTGYPAPGRFGEARRPTDDETLLTLDTEEIRYTLFDLRDGFVVSLDVKLEDRAEMSLISLDRNLVLELDEGLFPRAKIAVAGREQAEGSVDLSSNVAVPLHRWVTIRLVHDGVEAILYVDDRVGDRASFRGSMWQGSNDTFRVSEDHAPVIGLVDEVRLLAYERTERQPFPQGVELQSTTRRVRFQSDGRLRAPVEFTLVYGEARESHTIEPGGIIE